MFYYFGRKKRLAGEYPAPTEDAIFEPFSGSAAYSLHGDNWQRQVWVNDLDPVVAAIWRYLQEASPSEIASLPEPRPGERLRDLLLTDVERALISFHTGPGKSVGNGNDVVSRRQRWPAGKRYIIANLHKVKHWKITCMDYSGLPGVRATWFIDPPYQRESSRQYRCGYVDYFRLATWVESREGQVIVCEKEGADWLPFRRRIGPAIGANGSSYRETVWTMVRSGGTSAVRG